ncbi:hypothetical protein ACHAPK_011341, partial [Fusarium culmorum]
MDQHAHISVFSSSVDPKDDWRQISDLVQRRRIQNRLAQRTYRKKIKRRLEELERRAGPSDNDEPDHQCQKPTEPFISQVQLDPPEDSTEKCSSASITDNESRVDSPSHLAYPSYSGLDRVTLASHDSAQPYPYTIATETNVKVAEVPKAPSTPFATTEESYGDTSDAQTYPVGMPLVDLNTDSGYEHLNSKIIYCSQISHSVSWGLSRQSDSNNPPPFQFFGNEVEYLEAESHCPAMPPSVPSSPDLFRFQQY